MSATLNASYLTLYHQILISAIDFS